MMSMLSQDQIKAVGLAVSAAYKAAGLTVGETETIIPLRRLVAAYPLAVDEVRALTRRAAEQHITARAGRRLLAERDSEERLAGFIHVSPVGGWILVNRDDPITRRRFSVAHELGHYLLHFQPLLTSAHTTPASDQYPDDMILDEELQTPGDDTLDVQPTMAHLTLYQIPGTAPADVTRLEAEANLFAAGILAPDEICRRLVAEHSRNWGTNQDVLSRRLAGDCLMSQQAMYRRLTTLALP